MTLLPIVERELRRASRRRSTYWIRLLPVLMLLVPGYSALFLLSQGTAGAGQGKSFFFALSTFVFGLCLLSGAFLTADALSEEKREGTLGFLFLTDLRGYDVVLGKLAARMLNPFYALLAIQPVLALPLLMGGISASEFWRTAAALLNTLFFSLSIGIFISALSREQAPAVGRTVFLVGLLTVGLPVAGKLLRGIGWGTLAGTPSWPSPYTALSRASDSGYNLASIDYWGSFFTTLCVSLFALGFASVVLTRMWQDRPRTAAVGPSRIEFRAKKRVQVTRDPKWLDRNPVWWLIGGDRFLKGFSWFLVLAWGGLCFVSVSTFPESASPLFHLGRICGFLVACLIALQACRFFAEARRNGTWELLLSTPLSQRQILQGHWLALREIFLWPVILFFGIQFATLFASILHGNTPDSGISVSIFGFTGFGWFFISTAGDILAVVLFGTWLSLSMKHPKNAAVTTILLVLIVPSLVLCTFGWLADLVFIVYAAGRLSRDFRRPF